MSPEQARCLASAYAASGQPLFFALGVGVAGPNGVLSHRSERTTSDGKGIDHFEASGIVPAFIAAAEECGLPVGE